MAHRPDQEIIQTEHNTARFFTENRQIAWVLLLGTLMWGVYAYIEMPKRKDPDTPVRVAAVVCEWPGSTAQQVEQLITRPIEETIAHNSYVHEAVADNYGIKSLSMPGLSIVQVQLVDSLKDPKREFADINLKINALNDKLPQGAGPIQFNGDFGDTAALMLTVASPLEGREAIAVRAHNIEAAIVRARTGRHVASRGAPATIIYCFPPSVPAEAVARDFAMFTQVSSEKSLVSDAQVIRGTGFIGIDGFTEQSDVAILATGQAFIQQRLHESEFHPDVWAPGIVREPAETEKVLLAISGNKYSYHQLDDFTDLLARTIQNAPEVSRVERSGVCPNRFISTIRKHDSLRMGCNRRA
jgi:hypothetical protein